MTTIQIISDTRKRLLELSSGVIEDDQIIGWMNLNLTKISQEILTQDRIKKTTFTFTSGETTLPTNFLSFYFAKDYNWYSIEDFENDVATNMLCRIENTIKIKPTTITSLDVYYYRKPIDLSLLTPSVEPELPTLLHEAIVLGTVSRALEALQEFELSNLYLQKYTTFVTEARITVSNIEEKGFKSKQFFSYQKLI